MSRYYQPEQLNNEIYIKIPVSLIEQENYKGLKPLDYTVFGILYRRTQLSARDENQSKFCDNNGLFIYYNQKELAKYIGVGKDAVIQTMKRLESHELIERRKQENSTNRAHKIYLLRPETQKSTKTLEEMHRKDTNEAFNEARSENPTLHNKAKSDFQTTMVGKSDLSNKELKEKDIKDKEKAETAFEKLDVSLQNDSLKWIYEKSTKLRSKKYYASVSTLETLAQHQEEQTRLVKILKENKELGKLIISYMNQFNTLFTEDVVNKFETLLKSKINNGATQVKASDIYELLNYHDVTKDMFNDLSIDELLVKLSEVKSEKTGRKFFYYPKGTNDANASSKAKEPAKQAKRTNAEHSKEESLQEQKRRRALEAKKLLEEQKKKD